MTDNQNTQQQIILAEPPKMKVAMRTDEVITRFAEAVGKGNAMGYISSVLVAVAASEDLQKCTISSVVAAGLRAAIMHLSVDPAVAHAYIVPYRDNQNNTYTAQFQVGYKGLMYMCIRTNWYKHLHLVDIYSDDVLTENPVTGEISLKRGSTSLVAQRNSKIDVMPTGHLLYMESVKGYKAWYFMTAEECEEIGKKYSKSYYDRTGLPNKKSLWHKDPVAMHRKTVIRHGIQLYGYLDPQDLANMNAYDDVEENGQDESEFLKGINFEQITTPSADQSLSELGQEPGAQQAPIETQATTAPEAPATDTPAPAATGISFDEAAMVKSPEGKLYIAMSDKDLKDAEQAIGKTLAGELNGPEQNAWLLRLEAVQMILRARTAPATQPTLS